MLLLLKIILVVLVALGALDECDSGLEHPKKNDPVERSQPDPWPQGASPVPVAPPAGGGS